MTVIVCTDNSNGMLFGGRRQSRDRELVKHILDTFKGKIFMHPYSAALFAGAGDRICARIDFLSAAGEDDVCFDEVTDPSGFAGKIHRVIKYRWNRAYPGDVFFTLPLGGMKLVSSADFAGFSHEKITEEVYER